MEDLTKRQREILDYLIGYLAGKGYPPTIREIREAFGLSSNRGIVDHLKALERKGCIRRTKGSSRAIEIVNGGGSTHVAVSEQDEVRRYPIAGRIVAGTPAPPVEDESGGFLIDGSLFYAGGDFLLEVKGDSMSGEHILEGDLVVVKRAERCENGDTVVAMIDGEATVKRYYQRGSTVELRPANPSYEPIVFGADGMQDCRLIGIVIGVIRRY
jgi:repressor LexA